MAGSALVVVAFVLLCVGLRRLNLPKKITFWAAVIIEAVGMIVYVVHLFPQSLPYLDTVAFLLFVAAFVLLSLGLTLKGF